MNQTTKLLDAAKKRLGLSSDYALAKRLGITTARMSNYRQERRGLDEDICFTVAELLDMEPGEVLAMMAMDRAQDAKTRKAWARVISRIGSHAAAVLLVVAVVMTAPEWATSPAYAEAEVCILW